MTIFINSVWLRTSFNLAEINRVEAIEKYILIVNQYEIFVLFRTCWSLSCPGVDSILEPDKILDSAVEFFHRTGALHQEQLQVIRTFFY